MHRFFMLWIVTSSNIVFYLISLNTMFLCPFTSFMVTETRSKIANSKPCLKDVIDGYKFLDIAIGLRNDDNNCYMNAAIQALASSDKIIDHFKSLEHLNPDSQILFILIRLLEGVNNKSKAANIDSNSRLLRSLINEIGWNKMSQQDVLDVMSAIVNAVHNEMKIVAPEAIPPMKFEMVHRKTGCDMRDSIQYHIALTLGLFGSYGERPGVFLKDLITRHLLPTAIDGDSSKTTQMFFYQKSPEVLVLQISANKLDPVSNTMFKPEYHIQYDKYLKLDLTIVDELDDVDKKSQEQVMYKLHAVIHHMGSYSGGHYVTYRNFKGYWIITNDERVNYVSFDSRVCPYVMIYVKDDRKHVYRDQ